MIEKFGAVPSYRQIKHLKDYSKKAFIHFGINTFTGREWGDGKEDVSLFAPTNVDVRQWVSSIKECGFDFVILTAKHHDGFCLWPSKYTEHSIKNTAYKNGDGDIVREFTDACREFDIDCGIYISPWDRFSPYWGSDEYNTYYNNQLTELLTNYGKINEVWWDGAGSTEAKYDWGMWANTVRTLQPDAVIFGSLGATPYVECRWVGNEGGFAGDPHYPTLEKKDLETERVAGLNTGKFGGDIFVPAEVDVSIRPGWFWHESQDTQVKSVEKLVKLWFNSVGRGAMMLLNFPPNKYGVICDTDIQNAKAADKIIKRTFAENLAAGAVVTANSMLDDRYGAHNILDGNYDTFYVANNECNAPVIEISLPSAVTFDTFAIGEKIEYGVRVKGYRVEASINGEWVVLADKKSMGHLWTENFERITSDKVRIVLYDTACAPIIREFGLYRLPDEYYEAEKKKTEKVKNATNLAHAEGAMTTVDKKSVTVNFGGIYPFNTVSFNGMGVWQYKLSAFDGAKFYTIYEGSKPSQRETVYLKETVETSYQLRFEVFDDTDLSGLDIGVFEC